MQLYEGDKSVFDEILSSRTLPLAVNRAISRVPSHVLITRVLVDDRVLYSGEGASGFRGVDGTYKFTTNAFYKVGVNTARMVRSKIKQGERGAFVDAAIREKFDRDDGNQYFMNAPEDLIQRVTKETQRFLRTYPSGDVLHNAISDGNIDVGTLLWCESEAAEQGKEWALRLVRLWMNLSEEDRQMVWEALI